MTRYSSSDFKTSKTPSRALRATFGHSGIVLHILGSIFGDPLWEPWPQAPRGNSTAPRGNGTAPRSNGTAPGAMARRPGVMARRPGVMDLYDFHRKSSIFVENL